MLGIHAAKKTAGHASQGELMIRRQIAEWWFGGCVACCHLALVAAAVVAPDQLVPVAVRETGPFAQAFLLATWLSLAPCGVRARLLALPLGALLLAAWNSTASPESREFSRALAVMVFWLPCLGVAALNGLRCPVAIVDCLGSRRSGLRFSLRSLFLLTGILAGFAALAKSVHERGSEFQSIEPSVANLTLGLSLSATGVIATVVVLAMRRCWWGSVLMIPTAGALGSAACWVLNRTALLTEIGGWHILFSVVVAGTLSPFRVCGWQLVQCSTVDHLPKRVEKG